MSEVVLFGIGDIAEVMYYFLTHDSEHQVVAFTVDKAYLDKTELFGLPVVPFENIQEQYPPDRYAMFVAVGYNQMNQLRKQKYLEAKAKGYQLISYVSSRTRLWPDAQIGENCCVMEDMTIQPFVTIGNNVILWSGNHIGHHTTIGDHCFITSHVVISGGVNVGECCFFGVNATIRDHIEIAPHCLIGAGALILKSTREGEVYVGPSATRLEKTSDQIRKI